MRRRDFIARTVPVIGLPFFLGGFTVRAYGRSPIIETLLGAAVPTNRILVLVQLGGGNDGINTVIPLNQYQSYATARGNIAIPEASVLKLNDTAGLHPSMDGRFVSGTTSVGPNGGMTSLWDASKLAVIQGVSYPNPNQSHFRATDIWLTAANYDEYLTTGWMGRYLFKEFPDYPDTPSSVMPDPVAIQIGSVVSLALYGTPGSMGISIQDPNTFYQLVNQGGQGGSIDTVPATPAGRELSFVRQVAVQSQQYAAQVKGASDRTTGAQRSTLYPNAGQNSLADQLKIVATLIAGGLKTRVYIVNIGGFDTHASQVVSATSTMTGSHATLLGKLSNAVMAFQDDMRLLGLEDRVVGATFSEFGRRVSSNASLGTDHGTAAPMFVFGKPVQGGIIGVNPSLTDLSNGNLKMQYDFRSVYASLLSGWLGVGTADLNSIMLRNFSSLPLIRNLYTSADDAPANSSEFRLLDNFPNPFNPSTTIVYELPAESEVRIRVFDMLGREVATLEEGPRMAGRHQVQFFAPSSLSSGIYVTRLESGSRAVTGKIILAR